MPGAGVDEVFPVVRRHDDRARSRRGFERAYSALGHREAFAMSVDDAEHESTRKNREATYAFFQRHLNLPGDATDLAVAQLTGEELRITATGQLANSLRGETNLSLNQREAARLGRQLDQRRRDSAGPRSAVRADAARLAGYVPPKGAARAAVFSGRYQRPGYAVERYFLPVDERYAVPLLVMVPAAQSPSRVVLYLHPEGKGAAAKPGGEMEWLVRQGCTVVAPDIIGTGELGPGYLESGEPGHGAFRTWFGYVLIGKSIVGRQMSDVMRTLSFIEQRFGAGRTDVAAISRGAFGALLLHTAAIEGVFSRVALLEPLLSYESLVSSRRYPLPYLQSAVPAALTAYDLPDLAATLAPKQLLLAEPRAGSGAAAEPGDVQQATAGIVRAYSAAGKPANFVVIQPGGSTSLEEALATWLN